ncbi:23S rRNA (adenine(2503)-C(2))-methyltransferase RlmN [Ureaplasma canigenitalium]|uniref:23S rRNA (adenine(2503)-C(2))-methyltransferase RlmN n=1 Tax=Ureaplasma canigenitalium TaxID=42092 RepID=UPI00068D613C|nr:23S rRNA (adenine(2503)-C(2))-methyltransferase RlmN [Ureaplasma canigenitalium]
MKLTNKETNIDQKSIFDYPINELEELLVQHDLKKFTATQIFEWLYRKRVYDFDQMTNLSKSGRAFLNEFFDANLLKTIITQVSKDGTIKFLFELYDGAKIETVLMLFEYGYSVCVTTQVGCNMGCTFCASGILKKKRNLATSEIVLQVYMAQLYLDQYALKNENENNTFTNDVDKSRIRNIVVMGIGEPFDNIVNVSRFIDIVNHQKGLEISKKKITVSTCGLVNKFEEWTNLQPNVGLAISLHASNDEVRSQIMPINRAFNIEKLLNAARIYINKTNRRITFEYIMLDGINDHNEHAYELVELLKGMLCYVNLIPYNPVFENGYKRSKNILNFANILQENGIQTTTRFERGSDIDAACGQLRAKEQGVL